MIDNVVLVTGGFDPIHSGHLSLIRHANEFGRVVVGLNSDEWLVRKKGKAFLPFQERKEIISNFRNVMEVIQFDDSDGTAIDAIEKIKQQWPRARIIFANGGDRNQDNIPETEYCKQNNVVSLFGIGGEQKQNSSSWILSNWVNGNFEHRQWGEFMTLYTNGNKVKVKEIIIDFNQSISLQRHAYRTEYWVVISGVGEVVIGNNTRILKEGDSVLITPSTIHKLTNIGSEQLKLVEIQHGTLCDETDIERLDI